MAKKPPQVLATDPPRLIWLEALRETARKLGRTPTQDDWKTAREAGIPSVERYARRFGSWSDALRSAGLALNREQEFTKEELLVQLRNLAEAKGRRLKTSDVRAAAKRHTCAKERTFVVKFGSVPEALKAADVYYVRKVSSRKMLADLRRVAGQLAHPIRTSDVAAECRRGNCASVSAYQSRFGSFVAAVRAAGLGYVPQALSREDLLAYLREFRDELGRNPTYREVQERASAGLMPTMMNYSKKFGGLHPALAAAGLAPPLPSPEAERENMLTQLRQLTADLGHVPVSEEWIAASRAGRIQSNYRFRAVFGSVSQAVSEAGLTAFITERSQRNFRSHRRSFRKELVQFLVSLKQTLGHVPTKRDVDRAAVADPRFHYPAVERTGRSIAELLSEAEPKVDKRRRRLPPDVLLGQLQDYYRAHGRIPTGPEWNAQRDRKASRGSNVYATEFGSWTAAWRAAGIEMPSRGERLRRIDNETLLQHLRDLANKLGRRPRSADIDEVFRKQRGPSRAIYDYRFGGFRKALTAAGLD